MEADTSKQSSADHDIEASSLLYNKYEDSPAGCSSSKAAEAKWNEWSNVNCTTSPSQDTKL